MERAAPGSEVSGAQALEENSQNLDSKVNPPRAQDDRAHGSAASLPASVLPPALPRSVPIIDGKTGVGALPEHLLDTIAGMASDGPGAAALAKARHQLTTLLQSRLPGRVAAAHAAGPEARIGLLEGNGMLLPGVPRSERTAQICVAALRQPSQRDRVVRELTSAVLESAEFWSLLAQRHPGEMKDLCFVIARHWGGDVLDRMPPDALTPEVFLAAIDHDRLTWNEPDRLPSELLGDPAFLAKAARLDWRVIRYIDGKSWTYDTFKAAVKSAHASLCIDSVLDEVPAGLLPAYISRVRAEVSEVPELPDSVPQPDAPHDIALRVDDNLAFRVLQRLGNTWMVSSQTRLTLDDEQRLGLKYHVSNGFGACYDVPDEDLRKFLGKPPDLGWARRLMVEYEAAQQRARQDDE
jgi:hypothetical protein